MERTKWLRLFVVCAFWLALLSGCAHVISPQLSAQADKNVTVSMVQKDPQSYIGKTVIWSGKIITSEVLKGNQTSLEVLQQPTGFGGRPKNVDYSEGRFLVVNPAYLDPAIYKKGRQITIAGDVEGVQVKPLGQTEYRYPVIRAREIHLWEEERPYPAYAYPYAYPYSPYYSPFYPYPYWSYDPFWGPYPPFWP